MMFLILIKAVEMFAYKSFNIPYMQHHLVNPTIYNIGTIFNPLDSVLKVKQESLFSFDPSNMNGITITGASLGADFLISDIYVAMFSGPYISNYRTQSLKTNLIIVNDFTIGYFTKYGVNFLLVNKVLNSSIEENITTINVQIPF